MKTNTLEVRVHPTTKELIEPLFTWRGQAVWPVLGGSGEGDDTSGGTDSDPDEEDEATENDEDTSGTTTESVSREDFEKLRNQLRASDKNKAALEKRLKELDDANKDELTKATERVAELEKQTAEQDKALAGLRLQNAFLTAETGISWHDPGDALALAERKGYLKDVVGEDGEVDSDSLKAKLKELAKASPHLVKNNGSDSGSSNAPASRTGGTVGTKGTKTKDTGPDLSRYSRFLNQ